MGFAMFVGARAVSHDAPVWLRCGVASTEGASMIGAVLAAPAGWLAFAFLVPVLGLGVQFGWRLRVEEPVVGWAVACSAGLAGTACFGCLLWLL
jgi:hypothetical protein